MTKLVLQQLNAHADDASVAAGNITRCASASLGQWIEAEKALSPPSDPPLTQLFRTQYRQLLRFCRVRVCNEADAEDIVQSAFLSARRAYPDKGIEELRPLLFTLVRNLSVNHLKLHWNKLRHGEDISEAGAALACPQSPTPEKQLMDSQDIGILEAALAGMSPRRREALRLHRFDGLTYDEIAKRLSVSATTVKSDVAEAVAEIAGSLARAGRRTAGPAG